jgi:hypothetical protein
MCELLVGLPAINVLAVDNDRADAVVVHTSSRMSSGRAVWRAVRRRG